MSKSSRVIVSAAVDTAVYTSDDLEYFVSNIYDRLLIIY